MAMHSSRFETCGVAGAGAATGGPALSIGGKFAGGCWAHVGTTSPRHTKKEIHMRRPAIGPRYVQDVESMTMSSRKEPAAAPPGAAVPGEEASIPQGADLSSVLNLRG